MPLPVTVSCFIKIQIGFTFLVLAHPGSSWQRAIKWAFLYSYALQVPQLQLQLQLQDRQRDGFEQDSGILIKN